MSLQLKIDARFAHLPAYRARLLARPSFARAVDAARPFRANFPLGRRNATSRVPRRRRLR